MGVTEAQGQAERAADNPWVERLFRAGLVAKAVLYAVVGVLALGVAIDVGGRTTDTGGALQTLADQPFGRVLMVLLAIGLLGYAAWRIAQAVLDTDDEGDGAKAVVTRIGAAASALIHLGLMVLAIRLVADSGSGSGGAGGSGSRADQESQATAGVFDWPAGRWIVLVAAAVVIGVGAYNVYEGISRGFMDKMRVSGSRRRLVERLGVVGYVARGVVFGIAGVFLAKAAIEYDAKEAVGIDGALAELADRSFGPVLLGIVAAGLIAYALTCLAWARYREF
jgi:fumarate reductase subunit D